MKHFTDDETGEKFEVVDTSTLKEGISGAYVIKPVVRAETVEVKTWHQGNLDDEAEWRVYLHKEVGFDEGQAVKRAIKSFMEYINDPLDGMNHRPELDEAIYEARKALKGNAL